MATDVVAEEMGEIRVGLGDLDALVRSGVAVALREDPRIVLNQEVGRAGVVGSDAAGRVDVVVLDATRFRTPAAVVEAIRFNEPCPVVFLADRVRAGEISALLSTGVGSCVARDCSASVLRQAVMLTAQGFQVRVPIDGLTPAEERVLALLRVGLPNGEIAAALHVSVETVRTHAQRIYRELGVSGRDAVRLVAVTHGAARSRRHDD